MKISPEPLHPLRSWRELWQPEPMSFIHGIPGASLGSNPHLQTAKALCFSLDKPFVHSQRATLNEQLSFKHWRGSHSAYGACFL
ncbi:hypothetical protein [Pedosphaera parvula]|uniref:Uncharacterized protein n=1 Tax=Pedosphaera parvula (strain Ellin514) TaxID=320771 RepID=B9XFZ7_PEDPL|nr:hypothetical protein [Pedosphaera parvula]EEF61159.1 hypothetical protein Cflav_PD3876 [Pedosphaera parvula Ellin514]